MRTDRPHALMIDLPSSPNLRLSRTARQVTVPAGGEAAASFPVGPQAFNNEGVCRIPYRVSVANGAPQDGETTVDLRIQSRWLVTRRIQPEPKLERESGEDATAAKSLLSDGVCPVGEVFSSAKPPHGWQLKSFGSYLPVGDVGQLPSRGSAAIAVTRMTADADREAVVVPDTKWLWKGRGEPPAIEVLVWVNDEIVYNSTANEKKRAKPFRIRKTGNTLAVECRSRAYSPITPWNVRLEFLEAKDRSPLKGLVFDMNQR